VNSLGDEMGKIGSKLLIAIALSWIWALVCAPPTRAQSWSNGYGFRRTITIDHTKVANTDQTNFPILVSGAYSDMATVANGGSVTSSSGYDITFTSDAAGSSVLAFEQDVYNPSSGAFTYWVKIPTLSHTADTTLYLFYGNSSITTDHSNKTAVWDANYVGVWHLANGTTLSGADSTSNAYNLTNHNGTPATTGQVDGAASFNGSNNYLSNSVLSISAGSSITISFWNYVAAANQSGSAFTIGSSDIPNRIQANAPWSDGTLYWDYGTYSSGRISQSYSNYLGSWTYVALEFDSSSSKHSIYLNGALTASSTNSNTPQTVQTGIDIGAWPSYYEHGNIDEFRVSTNARSADWVSTEYSNQSAPGTFSIIGSAAPGPSSAAITRLSPGVANWGDPVTIQGANFGAAQGGSSVSFNGITITPQAWSDTSIGVTVPFGAPSGPFSVAVNGVTAISPVLTIRPLPSGWSDGDIGLVGLAGSSSYSNGVFTIQGAGADIYGTADAFHFLYQPLSGDGAIVARVVSFQGGGSYPKAGVMIRETLAAGSTNAYTSHQGAGSAAILFQYRSTTGASTVQSTGSGSLPYWVKVVRSGNSFSGYMSSDGVNWVQVGGTQTITMAQNVDIGLAVASSTTTGLATATFDHASLQDSSISGGLVGTITRASDGTLVSGAQVRALQGGMVRTTVNSGSDGRYVFTALTAGLYDISTSASGLGTALNASVSIPAGAISRLDMSLTSPGTIQGRVTQSDGTTAISGATVLASAGQSSVGQTTTDSNGNYSLGGLGAATYQVQASAGNYVPATQSAPVTAGSSTTKNFSLQASTAVPITYVYDVLGRLVAAINPSGDTAIYSYDAVGNLLKISRQNSAQLSIISTNPIRGSVGSTVTIFGTGFSATPSQNTVQFNGVTATVQSASATQLMVTIPSSATTGPITVTTSAGTVATSSSFTIQ
jgi:YD repeat-containing protein